MNRKKNTGAVVVIVAALAGLWWFTQPTFSPVKIASAPLTAKPDVVTEFQYSVDPKSPALHPPASAPMAPPPPRSPQTPSAAIPQPADPQADLKTVFPDIARLWRNGDIMKLMQTYMPDEWARMTPEWMQQAQDLEAWDKARAAINPNDRDPKEEPMAQMYEALKDQTPTFNATGDEATYFVVRHALALPAIALPPGMPPIPGLGEDPPPMTLVMVKINGKWYIKEESIQN